MSDKNLDLVNKRRKRIRSIIIIAGIPLFLATLLLVAKVATMNLFSSSAIAQFNTGDFTNSQQNSERQKLINIFEPYKAHYNNGTSLAALGMNAEAIAELRTALKLSNGTGEVCSITANLAIAYEQYGDELLAEKDADGAQLAFDSAKRVIDGAGDECMNEDASDDASDSLDQTSKSLAGKGNTGDGEEIAEEEEPSESETQVIKEQLEKNDRERAEQEAASRGKGDPNPAQKNSPPPPPTVPKPW